MISSRRAAALAAALYSVVASSLLVATARADGSTGPVKYANGDVATATAECGPGDVCGNLTLANGDQVKILTGGSGHCNPYIMTFMRYHQEKLDAVWSTPTDRQPDSSGGFGGPKCGSFRNTHMMLDGGTVDMGIFQNKDGTVSVQFFGGSS
ncbi:MAG TPA: hypothetical protein VID24_01490 [Candidatus Eremiobacteraceae bacterium]|jgi:hypothetical protein